MRKLGLTIRTTALASLVLVGCKAAPEPSPAEASAPKAGEASRATVTAAPPGAPDSTAPAASTAGSNDAPNAGSPHLYGQATKSVSARKGERFGIALESNVTVPFKWRLDPPDAKVVTLVDEKHRDSPPPGCGDCVGYGGTRLYTFEAKGPGTASLHFALKPLTDPAAQSQKEVTVSLTVTD